MTSGTMRDRRSSAFVAFIIVFVLVALMAPHAFAQNDTSMDKQTTKLASLVNDYRAATDQSERARLLSAIAAVAGARRAKVLDTIKNDPGAAIRFALPKKHHDALPADVQALVEHDTEVTGELQVLAEDLPTGSRVHHFLKTKTSRLELHFANRAPHLPSGAKVKVQGLQLNNVLALSSDNSVQTVAPLTSGNTFGTQKLLVLLVNFQDNNQQPYPISAAQQVFFNDTNNFYRASSSQQMGLAGDVFGWFTLPMSMNSCDYNAVATNARAAATASGINLANYDRYVYAFPNSTSCVWWGLSTIGGWPSDTWVNGSLVLQVAGHELGHALGLYHAHSLTCPGGSIGTSCTSTEYGDTIDIMGFATGDFDPFHKEQIGWLNFGASPSITTVTAPGTYSIEPYGTPTLGAKALKIAKGDGTFYYVEYRQAVGADATMSTRTQVLNGVVIRSGDPLVGNSSYLLDMTPVTTPANFNDPALAVGQTFTDANNGLSIKLNSLNASGASVIVTTSSTGATCTLTPPTVSLSPNQTPWVSPGAIATFNVTIKNNNTSGCAAAAFGLDMSLPNGWTAALAGPAITIPSGASVTVAMQVTAPTATSTGFYPVTITATQSDAPTNSGLANGTVAVQVASSCTTVPPSLNLGAASPFTPGSTQNLTLTLTNNNGACASSVFNLNAMVPNGWTKTIAGGSSMTLASGASTTTTMQLTAPATAVSGSYAVIMSVTQADATSNSAATALIISVTTPAPTCSTTAPTVTLSSPSAAIAPGATATLTGAIRNNNSSACASVSYNFQPTVPSGWSAVLVTGTSVTLGSGLGTSVTMLVTAPASIADGTYPVSLAGSQSNALSNSALAAASVVVKAPAPVCTVAAPSVTLTPGMTPATTPGSAATFTASVKNNNSSGCAASTFNLSSAVPAGWAASVTSGSTLTLAAGATGSAAVQVTVPAAATDGNYAVTLNMVQANALSNSSSAAATVVVKAPAPVCTVAVPTVGLTSSQGTTLVPGVATIFTVSVKNNNAAACAVSTFNVQPTAPSGWAASVLGGNSWPLTAGSTGYMTLIVTPASAASAGSFSLSVAGTQADTASNTASAAMNVSIQGSACTLVAPVISLTANSSSAAVAGTAAPFTLSVKNNNGAGCSAASFNVQSAAPGGWTLAMNSTVSVASGATATVPVQVTPASTANGAYAILLVVSQAGAPGSGSTVAIVTVVPAANNCTTAMPSVTLAPAQSSAVVPGAAASFTVSVKNNNSASCSAAAISLQPTVPSGWTSSLGASMMTLASGATSTTTLQVTSASAAANGSYNVSVAAGQAGSSSNSASGTVAVQAVQAAALTMTVSTDHTSYRAGNTVQLTAVVKAAGVAVQGALATITVAQPNGNVYALAVVTDATGQAKTTFQIAPGSPVGTYTVKAAGSKGTSTGTASAVTFTVTK